MKFSLLFAPSLIAAVSGQAIVSITSPLSGTKLVAGTDAVISWVMPHVPTISQIVLAKGPSNALQPVTTIATNVDTASGRYVWKIPYELENGDYAFELGTSPDLAFAGPFTIEGGVGGTPAQSNATTSSPAVPPPAAVPSSSAVAPAPVPSSAPPIHSVSPPAPAASNAKVPASGSSPTGSSSANQLSATGARCMMAVTGAVILAYQLF